MRKSYCYVCGALVDEATRFNSLQHFDHVVCSMKCGIELIDIQNEEEMDYEEYEQDPINNPYPYPLNGQPIK